LNPIIDFLNYITKPENYQLLFAIIGIIVSALSIGVTILLYYLNRRNIPKLVFDGVWKQNAHVGIDYFVRIKRDKGEGKAEEVEGFVGIKDKLELTPSRWIERNIETDIITYDYLSLFKILEYKEHEYYYFWSRHNMNYGTY